MTGTARSGSERTPVPGHFAEAFARHRPQGTNRWNFSAAFTQLERIVAAARRAAGVAGGDAGATAGADAQARDERARGPIKRTIDRHVLARLEPWVAEQAEAAARRAVRAELVRVEEGIDAATEAFRFLGARVEGLEDAAARRHDPVDGIAWLTPVPELEGWAGPVAERLRAAGPDGGLLCAECGDGTFAGALEAALGRAVRGCEPRGALALAASEHGLDVDVGDVGPLLEATEAGSLAGIVLTGIVDRAPLEDLVALVDLVTGALAPGAPLVVVGTAPEAAAARWDPIAADLAPGRPLHPETWALLLARAGCDDVEVLGGPPAGAPGTFAVGARNPS